MSEFITFLKDQLIDISNMLDMFSFDIFGVTVSIFELLLGFLVMSIIICLFWKGARG